MMFKLVSHYDILCSSRNQLYDTCCSSYCGFIDSGDNVCDNIYLFYCPVEEEETITNTQ